MLEFMSLGVKPDVVLPPLPEGAPPPWMAKRPAGIRPFWRRSRATTWTGSGHRFPQTRVLRPDGLSNPDENGEIADRLATVR